MRRATAIRRTEFVLPWVVITLLIVLTVWINSFLDLGSLSYRTSGLFPADISGAIGANLQSATKELVARIGWGLSSLAFSLAAIAAIGTAVWIVAACVWESSVRKQTPELITIACLPVAITLLLNLLPDVLTEPGVTSDLRAATLHQFPVGQGAVRVDILFDQFSHLIFFCLAVAASVILLWITPDEETAAVLLGRVGRMQLLLYVGATALTLRALEMFFFYRWPGAWLTAPTSADSVDRGAVAVSVAHGAFYSAVLASIYLPTAFLMRSRANSLAKRSVSSTDETSDAWLAKSGLRVSPFHEVGRVVAILAPLITGASIGKVIGLFGG